MLVKFQVHKELKLLLEKDLANKPAPPRTLKGINTYFFGDNRQGKCGIGNDEPYVKRPQCIMTKFKMIASGHHHNLGVDGNKVLFSWGRNRFGQLGQGMNEEEDTEGRINNCMPQLVKGILHNVIIDQVSCGW